MEAINIGIDVFIPAAIHPQFIFVWYILSHGIFLRKNSDKQMPQKKR